MNEEKFDSTSFYFLETASMIIFKNERYLQLMMIHIWAITKLLFSASVILKDMKCDFDLTPIQEAVIPAIVFFFYAIGKSNILC